MSQLPLILLLERNDAIAVPLIQLLRKAGYAVRAARIPLEAFDTIEREPIDLILINRDNTAVNQREFWMGLDSRRRKHLLHVLTFRYMPMIEKGGARNILPADVEIQNVDGFGLLIDAVQARVPQPTRLSPPKQELVPDPPKKDQRPSQGIAFVSYSRTDTAFVDALDARLRFAGFQTWIDRGHLEGGQQWLQEIEAAIDACTVMLVVLSPDAMRSKYVAMEYQYAFRRGKLLIPLDHRLCEPGMLLGALQILDFRTIMPEQAMPSLLRAIRSHAGK